MQTTLTPAYVYREYADDQNIQALNTSFNQLAQEYVTWFNTIGLPVYTGLNGAMLDWVATGLYGLARPVLTDGAPVPAVLGGLYGDTKYGVRQYGQYIKGMPPSPATFYFTSDDIYKRILTWRFYKGDGFYFSIPWLKRRIARFLIGTDGTAPNIDNTDIISVTINNAHVVTISFLAGNVINVLNGRYGTNQYGRQQYGGFIATSQKYPSNQYIKYFSDAVKNGVLALPFQYQYIVVT